MVYLPPRQSWQFFYLRWMIYSFGENVAQSIHILPFFTWNNNKELFLRFPYPLPNRNTTISFNVLAPRARARQSIGSVTKNIDFSPRTNVFSMYSIIVHIFQLFFRCDWKSNSGKIHLNFQFQNKINRGAQQIPHWTHFSKFNFRQSFFLLSIASISFNVLNKNVMPFLAHTFIYNTQKKCQLIFKFRSIFWMLMKLWYVCNAQRIITCLSSNALILTNDSSVQFSPSIVCMVAFRSEFDLKERQSKRPSTHVRLCIACNNFIRFDEWPYEICAPSSTEHTFAKHTATGCH